MPNAKHTQGKLKVVTSGKRILLVAEDHLGGECFMQWTVANGRPKDGDAAAANAARLVECWNSHDSLVAELTRLRDVVSEVDAESIDRVLKGE